jgi:ribosomal peptide maturation radical SAM protein 1
MTVPAPSPERGIRAPKVALVSLPWTNLTQPSLGLAILKAHLEQDDIAARVYHANLDLLAFMSQPTYDFLAECWAMNEFVFTGVFDPKLDDKQMAALEAQCAFYVARRRCSGYTTTADLVRLVISLRNHVIPTYLANCADRILAMEPTIVGFTCMFDQTIASAALATLLKTAMPDLVTVLGGYAVQHDAGIQALRAFPSIDCIARGDGEPVISKLARASVGNGSLHEIGGVLTRRNMNAAHDRIAPKWNMTQSITANFDDWFADVRRVDNDHHVFVDARNLPIESSRGCWWGQKHHCTFCGIDEESLKYRSKSSEQILAELTALRARYGPSIAFRFADYIWPHEFYAELLPKLAEFDPPLYLSAEIKANQTRANVRAFANAGFVALQPGIESFASTTLRKMDKGVTAIKNVQLLKWGYLDGIDILYNLLFGFPDDEEADYAPMLERIPRLYHLAPPVSHSRVVVTRFAPLQTSPQRYGHADKPRHHRCYEILFSDAFLADTGMDLDDYCYYFDRWFPNSAQLREIYAQISIQAKHWKDQHRARDVYLAYERTGPDFVFEDTRYGTPERFSITGRSAEVYALCDGAAMTFGALADQVAARSSDERAELQRELDGLDEKRLLWIEDDRIFGLGTPIERVQDHIEAGWKSEWVSLLDQRS